MEDNTKKGKLFKSFLSRLEQPTINPKKKAVGRPRLPDDKLKERRREGKEFKDGRIRRKYAQSSYRGRRHWRTRKKISRERTRKIRARTNYKADRRHWKTMTYVYHVYRRSVKYRKKARFEDLWDFSFEEYQRVWNEAPDVFCPKQKKWVRPWDAKSRGGLYLTDGAQLVRIDRQQKYCYDNMTIQWYKQLLPKPKDNT